MGNIAYISQNYLCKKISRIEFISINNQVLDIKTMHFFTEDENYCITVMKFPAATENKKEKQVQNMNYEYFVHTMADMLKKYAPEMLE